MSINQIALPLISLAVLLQTGCNYGGIPEDDSSGTTESEPTISRITVAEVVDYSPAPGQFVNLLPPASDGETAADIRAKAADYLNRGYAITLGAFGGSVTLRLSEPIIGQPGVPDFFVAGNAISNSSEPGIVEVSQDGSVWYQLCGEFSPGELPDTHIIYRLKSYSEDIPFTATTPDGSNSEGEIKWLPNYRSQSYWPLWISDSTLTFTSPRLPDNARLNPSTGQYEFTPFAGYADSYPNSSSSGYLSLGDAIDPATGTRPELKSITFVRVTTSILQSNGPLGEASTEVSGVYRLSF